MMTFLGQIFAISCIFGAYLLHGGSFMVFAHAWTEFIAILGGAAGIYVAVGRPPPVSSSATLRACA